MARRVEVFDRAGARLPGGAFGWPNEVAAAHNGRVSGNGRCVVLRRRRVRAWPLPATAGEVMGAASPVPPDPLSDALRADVLAGERALLDSERLGLVVFTRVVSLDISDRRGRRLYEVRRVSWATGRVIGVSDRRRACSGKMRAGESARDAAAREIAEELGVDAAPEDFTEGRRAFDISIHSGGWPYLLCITHMSITLPPEQVREIYVDDEAANSYVSYFAWVEPGDA